MAVKLVGRRLILTGADADLVAGISKRTGVPKKWLIITALTNYVLRSTTGEENQDPIGLTKKASVSSVKKGKQVVGAR